MIKLHVLYLSISSVHTNIQYNKREMLTQHSTAPCIKGWECPLPWLPNTRNPQKPPPLLPVAAANARAVTSPPLVASAVHKMVGLMGGSGRQAGRRQPDPRWRPDRALQHSGGNGGALRGPGHKERGRSRIFQFEMCRKI